MIAGLSVIRWPRRELNQSTHHIEMTAELGVLWGGENYEVLLYYSIPQVDQIQQHLLQWSLQIFKILLLKPLQVVSKAVVRNSLKVTKCTSFSLDGVSTLLRNRKCASCNSSGVKRILFTFIVIFCHSYRRIGHNWALFSYIYAEKGTLANETFLVLLKA